MWGWGPAPALAQSLVSVVGGVIWENKFTGFCCITRLWQPVLSRPLPASSSVQAFVEHSNRLLQGPSAAPVPFVGTPRWGGVRVTSVSDDLGTKRQ